MTHLGESLGLFGASSFFFYSILSSTRILKNLRSCWTEHPSSHLFIRSRHPLAVCGSLHLQNATGLTLQASASLIMAANGRCSSPRSTRLRKSILKSAFFAASSSVSLAAYSGFKHRLSEEQRSIPGDFSLLSWMRHQNDSGSVSLETNVLAWSNSPRFQSLKSAPLMVR